MDAAPELEWLHRPSLRRPLLVLAFEGLFDAALAATSAAQHLIDAGVSSRKVARIDPETFFDFQQRRPEVAFDGLGQRVIHWPHNDGHAVLSPPEVPHDLVVMSGVEPHLRWRTFADALIAMARGLEAEMVITLGAMVGMAPHTRPLGVVGSTTNPDLARRLGLGRPSYQGPTGLVGVLHERMAAAELPVISLRVSVPHYVPTPPNPEATRSLLGRLELITGVPTHHQAFATAADEWRRQIDRAVADDEDLRAYVTSLEAQVDENEDLLPSGDDLANQLQAFLRDQSPE